MDKSATNEICLIVKAIYYHVLNYAYATIFIFKQCKLYGLNFSVFVKLYTIHICFLLSHLKYTCL
jgi:hypothetical protein